MYVFIIDWKSALSGKVTLAYLLGYLSQRSKYNTYFIFFPPTPKHLTYKVMFVLWIFSRYDWSLSVVVKSYCLQPAQLLYKIFLSMVTTHVTVHGDGNSGLCSGRAWCTSPQTVGQDESHRGTHWCGAGSGRSSLSLPQGGAVCVQPILSGRIDPM